MVDTLFGLSEPSRTDVEDRSRRLGLKGKITPQLSVKVIAEFSDGHVALKDGFIFYREGRTGVRIGHFKSSNSLEEITSFTSTLFLERSAFTDVFGFGRYPGVAVRREDTLWGMEVGFFRPVDGGMVLASRGHYGGEIADGKWLLGGAFRLTRSMARDGEEASKANATDVLPQDDPSYEDNADDFFWGLEAAIQSGRLHMASEWGEWTQRNTLAGTDTVMSGGYLETGWFLTGEVRPLLLDKGIWGRPTIMRSLSDGGGGAWQLGGRFEWLRQPTEEGMRQTQKKLQAALHWYAEKNMRMTLQYDHLFFSRPAGFAGTSSPNEASHQVGLRAQFAW